MNAPEKVNILVVDDQPAKLLSLETILEPLRENVLKATCADEALKLLLAHEIAVVLVDVCMPGMDGFELAEMIRDHPRYRRTAIIFISAVHLTDADRLRGYGLGAVDYIPVPIIPDVLRAKVAVFAELFRKTEQLNAANRELERRVAERTAELEKSNQLLRESREQVALELAATQHLQSISTRLILEDRVESLYDRILDAAVAIMRSDFASLQMYHTERGKGELRLLAHRGFSPEAAEHWKWVNFSSTGSCGSALRSGIRVQIADTAQDPNLAGTPDLEFFEKLGVRACQTTPLVSRSGRLVGMISTHWRRPTTPAQRELQLLDVLGRQAADLIERSQNEHALRESEAKFRTLADTMPQLAWMADGNGSVFWYNRRWFEFTGLTQEESRDWGWTRTLHPEDAARVIEKIRACFVSGEAWEDTYLTRGADGAYRWFLCRAFPVRDEQSAVTRWFGTGTDVTEQREAQQVLARDRETLERLVAERTAELHRSNERLRLSQRMATIGTLAAGLGHDIGNLLLPVRMRLDALDACSLPEHAREDTGAIRKAVEYLQRLAGSLRLLALDSRSEEAADSHTEVQAWWREAEGMIRNALAHTTKLSADIPAGLPAVRIGKAGLTQVVFNLVQNAADALAGRDGGRIDFAASSSDGRIVLTITDNGPGMSEETRRRCFEPFYTTKARELSTGLGLPLVSAIVQRTQGTLHVDSAPGSGTTFRIELPAARAPARPERRGHEGRRTAAVLLQDQRMAAIVRAALHQLRYDAPSSHASDADLWIADASDSRALEKIRASALLHPDRMVVLFANANDPRPELPRAVFLEAPVRMSEVRCRLTAALAQSREPELEHT